MTRAEGAGYGQVRDRLDGCLEIAQSNIDNDFADSMKERYESSKEDADRFYEELKGLKSRISKTELLLSDAYRKLDDKDARIRDLALELDAERARSDKSSTCLQDMRQKAEKADQEIICLKARLYDLMTA